MLKKARKLARKYLSPAFSVFFSLYLVVSPLLTLYASPVIAQDGTISDNSEIVQTPETPVDVPTTEPVQVPEIPAPAPVVEEPVVPVWSVNGSTAVTNKPVVLGEIYTAPQNEDVTLVFTKLPETSSPLTITEVVLTDAEVAATGAISNIAYDITTDMVDGTFAYTLTLPTDGTDVSIKYAESRSEILTNLQEVTNPVVNEGAVVKVEGMDHFSIYIATYSDSTLKVEKAIYYQGEIVYVKAGDLSTNKYYKIGIIDPDGNYNSLESCKKGASAGLSDTFPLASNAHLGTGWKAELKSYSDNHCDDWFPTTIRDSFEVKGFVADPKLTLVDKHINGNDADISSGVTFYQGDDVVFTYEVKNTGNVTITDLKIVDSDKDIKKIDCLKTTLNVGDSTICTSDVQKAISGAYTNTAYAQGKFDKKSYDSNSESAYYYGGFCGDNVKNGPEVCDGSDGLPNSEFSCVKNKCELELVDNKVGICHATDSQKNPYVSNQPAKEADVQGHNDHNGGVWYLGIADHAWGDIIPSFWYLDKDGKPAQYLGKNWTTEGQAVWSNNCAMPVGKIIVEKTTYPADSSQVFGITAKAGDVGSILNDVNGTISDSASYTYNVTPGIYSLEESNVDGWDFTRAYCSDESTVDAVHVGVGETLTCTFVNTQRGTISGHKLDDRDGKYETSDDRSPLSGWTIELYQDGILLTTRVTDLYGDYSFSNLVPGTYTLKESLQTGWMKLSPSDEFITVVLEAGENDTDNDFVNVKYPEITVFKNVDTDGDNEVEITNATDWKWKLNDTEYGMGVKSNMTLPGTYTISEVQKDGYSVQNVVCGDTNYGVVNSVEVTVGSGDQVTCTFTNTREVGSVKVNKYVDLNGDGDWNDRDEKSNSNAKSLGFKWSMDSGLNNDMGEAQFSVPTGSHFVTEKNVNKYHFVSWYYTKEEGKSCTNPNGRELPITVEVAKGQQTEITLCNAVDTGSITIVKDARDHSNQEFTFESNLPNKSLFKLEDDGNNNDGKKDYITVTVPVGSYNVEEKDTKGWKLTDLQCTGDNNSSANLGRRKATLNIDANESVTCTFTNTELGSIEGIKFNDKDGDAVKDWKEFGLDDWRIYIDRNGNGKFDNGEVSDTTNRDGEYSFNNLLPGTYSVCEKMQEGWYNSTPICQIVELGAGHDEKVNFGNHQALKIVASKVVCDTESGLPNWGNGAPDITRETAEEYVEHHRNCKLESGWNFQWGYNGEVMQDNETGWNVLGTTGHHGEAELKITNAEDLRTIWVREVLKPGYVGFSNSTENSYSAEIYCSTDGLNYDNFDKIENPLYGNTYYCVAFNAKQTGDLKVTKEVLNPDGDPVTDTSTEFTINLDGKDFRTLTDGESTVYENLPVGTYTITEDVSGNYTFDKFSADENVELSGAQVTVTEEGTTELTIYNRQMKGSILVYKDVIDAEGEDAYSNDEFTVQLADRNSEETTYTSDIMSDSKDEPMVAEFINLNPGEYSFMEVPVDGYNFLGCHKIQNEEESFNRMMENSEEDVNVELSSNETVSYVCRNQAIKAELQLVKSNNTMGADMLPGNTVLYTLKVTAPVLEEGGYVLRNAKVVDLTPKGFNYVGGTWTAMSSVRGDLKALLVTTEPTYGTGSLGTWMLGDMVEGEVVTLTYIAEISELQDPGLYKDLAWTEGQDVLGTSVIGEAPMGRFAGTEVNVVAPIEEGEAEVLGVAISLPSTGASAIISILALISSVMGVLLLVFGSLKKRKVAALPLAAFFLSLFIFAGGTSGVFADSDLVVRVEQPSALVNNADVKVGFVALDIQGRDVIAQCSKKSPSDSTFVDFGSPIDLGLGGNSGECKLNNTILNSQGTYEVKVTTVAGSDESSQTVSFSFDSTGPELLNSYTKTKEGCNYVLSFKTANDGQTSKVQIFRSTQKSFVADASTMVKELTVTPNQSVVYTDTPSTCDVEYYYALRALDNANNASDFTADSFSVITYTPAVVTPTTPSADSSGDLNGNGAKDGTGDSTGEVKGTDNAGNNSNTTDNSQNNGTTDSKSKINPIWYWVLGISLGGAAVWTVIKTGIVKRILGR